MILALLPFVLLATHTAADNNQTQVLLSQILAQIKTGTDVNALNQDNLAQKLIAIDNDLQKLTAVIEHPVIPPVPPPLPPGAQPCKTSIQNRSSVMVCPFPKSNLPVFPQIGPCQPIFAHGINQTICAPLPPQSQSFPSTNKT